MALKRYISGDAVFQMGSEPGKLWASVSYPDGKDWEEEHVEIPAADMAAHGYVGWKPVAEKPGESDEYMTVRESEKGSPSRWAETVFYSKKTKSWSRRNVIYWLPLPPLPESPKVRPCPGCGKLLDDEGQCWNCNLSEKDKEAPK